MRKRLQGSRVGEIGARFGEGAEVWRTLGPTHWETEGNANERFIRTIGWQEHSKLQDRMRGKRDSVVTTREIILHKQWGSIRQVAVG